MKNLSLETIKSRHVVGCDENSYFINVTYKDYKDNLEGEYTPIPSSYTAQNTRIGIYVPIDDIFDVIMYGNKDYEYLMRKHQFLTRTRYPQYGIRGDKD